MKAVAYREYGPPEVLRVEEIASPTPKDGEVLIQVRAAEVTKGDCELRSFRYPVKWFWLPLRLAMGVRKPRNPILGGYFAGVIAAVGSNVTKFRVGEEVFGSTKLRMGAYGEYLRLPEHYTIVPKPTNLTHEQAACVPLGGLNALHFMRNGRVRYEEKVLVNGAGGSIGLFAIQIAKTMGAEVTAVDAPHKESIIREAGADHFVDYTKSAIDASSERYHVILDMVPRSSFSKRMAMLYPNGRYLIGNPRFSSLLRTLLPQKEGKRASAAFASETVDELLALKQMIEQESIRPFVDRIYPMEDAPEAHRRVETEARLGSVALSVST